MVGFLSMATLGDEIEKGRLDPIEGGFLSRAEISDTDESPGCVQVDLGLVLKTLKTANEIVELQSQLEERMRDGFIELSSAKFSHGFNSANLISSTTYPEASGDINEDKAFITITVEMDREVEAKQIEEEALARKIENIDISKESSKKMTNNIPNNISNDISKDSTSGSLRMRNCKVKKLLSEPPDEDFGVEKKVESPEFLHKWLRIVPRGQLKKARSAFESSVDIILELARKNIELKQSLLPELITLDLTSQQTEKT